MKLRVLFLSILFASCSIISAAKSQEAGTFARLAFEHWYCHGVINFMKESERVDLEENYIKHGELGIEYARSMFDDLEKYGVENQENWDKNGPFIWKYYLAGSNVDFKIGRLYEATRNAVYEDISENPDGTFILSKELKEASARNEYSNRNCRILR